MKEHVGKFMLKNLSILRSCESKPNSFSSFCVSKDNAINYFALATIHGCHVRQRRGNIFVVTIVEAFTDQNSGNSTPFCSNTVSPVFQFDDYIATLPERTWS